MEEYTRLFEQEDVAELVGYFKGKYKSVKQVEKDTKFKVLSDADKEYVLDELKSEGL